MNLLLQKDRTTEYLTVALVWAVIFLCGLVSVFIKNDAVVLVATLGLVLSTLLWIKNVQPIFLLYALCAGVSFLPYINLQLFPLSGIYVVALLFVLLSVIYLSSGDKEIIFSPQVKWLALFLAIGVLYIGFSDYKRSSIIYCGQFLVYICVYWAAVNIVDSKTKIVQSLKYVVGGTVVTLVISAVQYVVSLGSLDNVIALFYDSIIGELFIGSKGLERFADSAHIILDRATNTSGSNGDVIFRVFGTFEGPTVYGTYLLLSGIIVAGLYLVQIKKKRVGFSRNTTITILLALTICLFATWTRSALLVFFMTIGCIFFIGMISTLNW